jgi:hypothetical protein
MQAVCYMKTFDPPARCLCFQSRRPKGGLRNTEYINHSCFWNHIHRQNASIQKTESTVMSIRYMHKENIYKVQIYCYNCKSLAACSCTSWVDILMPFLILYITLSAMNTFCSRSTTVGFCWKNLLFQYKFQSKSMCESHCPVCRRSILVQGLWTT